MSIFDAIKDSKGKEYLIFDKSELYDDRLIGNSSNDYEILKILGEGGFGKVFKVLSKQNKKVYAMKKIDLQKLQNNPKAHQLSLNETKFLEELEHAHIVKYYKNFKEDNDKFLYIIIEFAENGDLSEFINTYKAFNNRIPEEILWNIFFQCMDALSYIHSKKIIHRDIKPGNIFMDNNMFIKIGDFGTSAIKFERNDYNDNLFSNLSNTQIEKMKYGGTCVISSNYYAHDVLLGDYDFKIDVYSMGVVFYELVFLQTPGKKSYQEIINKLSNNNYYSKDLLDIIKPMLEPDKEKRASSSEIFQAIEKIYNQKFSRNSSINSIIRCLLAFNSLTAFFNGNNIAQINKPITQAYIRCIKSVADRYLNEWIKSILYFRQLLGFQNPKLAGTKEIDPRIVFAFIIKQLHLELNNSRYQRDKSKEHLLLFGQEQSKTSKFEVMIDFVNDFTTIANSIISNNFIGYMKMKYICNNCNITTYKMNGYCFITFNLEKILNNNINQTGNSKIKLESLFNIQNQEKNKNIIYCSKCLNRTEHVYTKEFYSFPNLLVISIQRGATFQYKNKIEMKEQLDLTGYGDLKIYQKIYQLKGIIKRKTTKENQNENEIFFCVFNYKQKWWQNENSDIFETFSPLEVDPEGDTIMIFYEITNNMIID